MHLMRPALLAVLLGVPSLFAVNKEMVQLQRDVSQLQEAMRTLQSSFDTKIAELRTMVQSAVDESKRSATGVAVLDSGIKDRLREQEQRVEQKVTAPVAGVGTKVDALSNDFSTLREAILELSQRMTKLSTEMRDVKEAVTIMRNTPPPPAPVDSAGGATSQQAAAQPVIPPAQQLFDKAMSDKSGGNMELALAQFRDFVKYYPSEALAPNAQFYVGEIYYNKGDFDPAVSAFDTVLERYPDNVKTPEATYMKGLALLRGGQKASARKVFEDVVKKYPNSDVAPKARTQLSALGGASTATLPMRKKSARR